MSALLLSRIDSTKLYPPFLSALQAMLDESEQARRPVLDPRDRLGRIVLVTLDAHPPAIAALGGDRRGAGAGGKVEHQRAGLRWMDGMHVLYGYGLESFRFYSPRFFPLQGEDSWDPHNVYVQLYFETGALGNEAAAAEGGERAEVLDLIEGVVYLTPQRAQLITGPSVADGLLQPDERRVVTIPRGDGWFLLIPHAQ